MSNPLSNSVTELSTANGTLVKVVRGPSYGFDDPSSIACDGAHVWVANAAGKSVTELSAATAVLVKILVARATVSTGPWALPLGAAIFGWRTPQATRSRSCLPQQALL